MAEEEQGRAATEAAAIFDPHRQRLQRIAYRMLGSMAEAEDIVQDAFLRWLGADRTAVREPAAFLTRIVTRLCLDQLKSARARRETYIGPWLPEPIVLPESAMEAEDDLTVTLMLALERLTPLERAAFLLHDVFGLSFAEVAEALERDAAAARQLASRARSHVRTEKPRYTLPAGEGETIAGAFFAASRSGDVAALKALLAESAILYTDGGGKRNAALNPIATAEKIARFFAGIAVPEKGGPSTFLRYVMIDGLPGFVSLEKDGLIQTTAFEIEDGRITRLYIVRNPDKLARLQREFG
ncbi:RNA polymerase sigma-70 factor (ECF subfamily) [Dongia mobilis]|uniref:RNA polymerase sigma-70 factor (ECF subfamily) n=1 Tax=Dongia mobilis TaxID=578943 RepID=A0A4R6WRV3_9PROT|nr:sigma-70 family RNA polymerase sigma factor [Dongia mobilis]TDQ82287.1 RNA polymerase sigma-70 factor (ECF subfamily) [Dongia mobilis]